MERRTLERTCDACKKRLDDGGSWPNPTYIKVSAQRMEVTGDSSYLVVQLPVLDRDFHFCNIACIASFDWNEGVQHQP